jgi:hypothetical protein
MRRSLLLVMSLGPAGLAAGCGHGVCDCLVQPAAYGTPPPCLHSGPAADAPHPGEVGAPPLPIHPAFSSPPAAPVSSHPF